jgi:hypothetical protein
MGGRTKEGDAMMRLTVCTLIIASFPFAWNTDGSVAPSSAQRAGRVYSPTYGKPASNFVSGCEIYLFGEYIEPVEGPDGMMGFLIEKTDSAVTLNGRHFFSPYDPPRKVADTPLMREIQERGRPKREIIQATMEQFRARVQREPQTGAYSVDGAVYEPERLTPFVVQLPDRIDTVEVKILPDFMDGLDDRFSVFYKGEDLGIRFLITLPPGPPKEQDNEFILDMAYQGLAKVRPGFIILIGRGYKDWYPLSEAPKLKAALANIPVLAKPRHEGFYEGEWEYEWLNIDEYTFDSKIIRDFIGK